MKTTELTDHAIKTAKPTDRDYWLTESRKARGQGVLGVRVSPSGTKRFYYRYTAPDGSRIRLPIAPYGVGGITLAEARDKVRALQGLHRSEGSQDVRAHLRAKAEEQRAAQEKTELAERQRHEAEQRERERVEKYTLRKLLEAYINHMRTGGKMSANDAAGIFQRNVFTAFPDLAAKPAASITAKDVVAMLRKLTESGKGRAAAKLRSYLHAAYALTLRAELDPDAPADLVRFDLTANPVAPTGTLARYNKAGDRTLSEAELEAYWKALASVPEVIASALKLALLLGGQRPSQLLRVTLRDVDLAAKTITLRDGKGARKQPRIHVLPLLPDAHAIISALVARAEQLQSTFLFSTHGTRAAVLETLSNAVHGIATGMITKGTAVAPFQMRDIRRTCETMLAALGVSSDVRAQVQSHGLGGVQAKHYDRHSYTKEKAAALSAWEDRLRVIVSDRKPLPENVISIRRGRT